MGTKDKQEHQPEPWTQDGRYILDASGWTLASARFPGDARRIIAAVNSVQGIPTDALESWVVNVIGEPVGRADGDRRGAGGGLPEPAPNERRLGERRHGDRRSSRPELRVFGSTAVYREDEGGKDSQ
jgi:hypothetical protein